MIIFFTHENEPLIVLVDTLKDYSPKRTVLYIFNPEIKNNFPFNEHRPNDLISSSCSINE